MSAGEDSSLGSKSESPLGFVTEHIAILIPIIAAAIFYLRCLAVSNGDIYTASVLLSQTSIGDAVRSLMVLIAPLAFMIGAVMAAFVLWDRFTLGTLRKPDTPLLILVTVVGLLFGLFFLGTTFVGAAVITGILVAFAAIISVIAYFTVGFEPTYIRTTMPRWLKMLAIFAVTGLVIWVTTAQRFWFPPERIVFRGEAPFTGYVLKTSDRQVVVLVNDPRIVIERPSAELVDRRFCIEDAIPQTSRFANEKLIRRSIVVCPA